jgi:GNAT superfamily N-acetyltransferase
MRIAALDPDRRYHTRLLGPPDLRALQTLFERGGDYFDIATGRRPDPDEAPRAFVAGPPAKAVDDKRIIGIFTGRELVGVLDAITDWPGTGDWTMGMLLLDPAHRGHGLGTLVLEAYERWAAAEGAVRLHTALVAHHAPGVRFLERHGYRRVSGSGGMDPPQGVIRFSKAAPRGATE